MTRLLAAVLAGVALTDIGRALLARTEGAS